MVVGLGELAPGAATAPEGGTLENISAGDPPRSAPLGLITLISMGQYEYLEKTLTVLVSYT